MTADQTAQVTITTRQRRLLSWSTDVLIYIVVLNLFVEFADAIIIESFWISILTAVLLVALLDIVGGIEHRVARFFGQKEGTPFRILGYVTAFLILFASKFIILEVVDFVFGDQVDLGHFLDVLVLIVAMIVTTSVVGKIFDALGTPDTPPGAPPASSA